MDFLPKELENIIIDYKDQLELTDLEDQLDEIHFELVPIRIRQNELSDSGLFGNKEYRKLQKREFKLFELSHEIQMEICKHI